MATDPMQASQELGNASRCRGQSHLSSVQAVSSHDSASQPLPPIASPEAVASDMLEQEEINKQQLCQLLHSVCQDFANDSEQGKFHAGMYRHGGIAGLRRNCHKFPSVIRAVNQFVAQHLDVSYNAFVVLDNVASPMHRDTMNAPVPN